MKSFESGFINKSTMVFAWCLLALFFSIPIYGVWLKSILLYPGVHEDGSCYSTVVINQGAGLGNTFSVYTVSVKEKGDLLPFIGHGQIYYPIFSQLLSSPDFQILLTRLHQSNLIAFLLAFFVFLTISRRFMGLHALGSSLVGLGAGYCTLAVLEYLQGRPEHGIPFILILFLLYQNLTGKNEPPNWVSGIQIGIVAAISPLPGAIMGVASVFVSALRLPTPTKLIRSTTIKIVCALTAWAGATAIAYQGSLYELVIKILMAGEAVNEVCPAFRLNDLLKNWAMPIWAPGIGILYAMAFLVAAILAWHALIAKGALFSKVILFFCALLLLNRIWFNGISFSHINYSFLCFFPAVLAWLLCQHEKITKAFPFHESRAKRACLAGVAVALFLPSLGIVRNTLLLPRMTESGVPYSQTFERVKDLKATLEPGEYIFIPNVTQGRSAVIYDGPPWKMKHCTGVHTITYLKEKLGITGKYFFWPQFATVAPPEIPGFRLIENKFNSKPVKVLGIQISNHTPGHGYALYEKIP